MSRTLQNTMDWVGPIIRFMPLTIGVNNEPAMTNANIIQQTIMAPPFCWDWNRGTTTFNTVQGTQDYTETVATFGFIEKATLTDQNGKVKEISVRNSLSIDSTQGRPDFITSFTDDGAGGVVFRLLKIPDAVYTVTVIYQKRPTLLANLTDTWAIPDKYSYVYDYGFLTLALLHLDDPRLPFYNQKFVSALLSTNRGISDLERNIFIGNWMALTRQELSEQLRTQQGNQARGT